jgi:hypothetical protein
MKGYLALVGLYALSGCSEHGSCPNLPDCLPATGTAALRSGALIRIAEEQSITISPARDYLDYRFKLDGVSYVARYALSEEPPPIAYTYVFVRRSAPVPACGTMAGQGPIIDAIEVRRAGRTVAYGKVLDPSSRCAGQSPVDKAVTATLGGAPDGVGAPLGDADYGWQLTNKVTLRSRDEVVVTVLDTLGAAFDVLVGTDSYIENAKVSLGTLQGTGTLTMP